MFKKTGLRNLIISGLTLFSLITITSNYAEAASCQRACPAGGCASIPGGPPVTSTPINVGITEPNASPGTVTFSVTSGNAGDKYTFTPKNAPPSVFPVTITAGFVGTASGSQAIATNGTFQFEVTGVDSSGASIVIGGCFESVTVGGNSGKVDCSITTANCSAPGDCDVKCTGTAGSFYCASDHTCKSKQSCAGGNTACINGSCSFCNGGTYTCSFTQLCVPDGGGGGSPAFPAIDPASGEGLVKVIIGLLIPVSIIIALARIIGGGYKILTSEGNETKLIEGRDEFTSGVVGLILSVIGIPILGAIITNLLL